MLDKRTKQNRENQKKYTKVGFNVKKEEKVIFDKIVEDYQYSSLSEMVKDRILGYEELLLIIRQLESKLVEYEMEKREQELLNVDKMLNKRGF